MQFSVAAILTTLLAGTALATPTPMEAESTEVKSMSSSATWTIRHLRRECDHNDSCCTWYFAVDDGRSQWCDCEFRTYSTHDTPASRAQGKEQWCGPYVITSGWSGQFGEGNGFTTFSVVDKGRREIAWPAYKDEQVWGGHVVRPDQCYPVQWLP
ncbi:unnamed protein product [Clonostachys rosea f. rosea IK726]|jgi:hypothetical protein|uniref:Small secreted protein n=2 Tax=Bionectria ochroleuca TaxID=29856 RepID=A0A0B7K1V2_BIOOC|nr:unnamed protein product [Clonostachys rosea f. rosea IK726]